MPQIDLFTYEPILSSILFFLILSYRFRPMLYLSVSNVLKTHSFFFNLVMFKASLAQLYLFS